MGDKPLKFLNTFLAKFLILPNSKVGTSVNRFFINECYEFLRPSKYQLDFILQTDSYTAFSYLSHTNVDIKDMGIRSRTGVLPPPTLPYCIWPVFEEFSESESESDEYIKDTNTGFYLTAGECAI